MNSRLFEGIRCNSLTVRIGSVRYGIRLGAIWFGTVRFSMVHTVLVLLDTVRLALSLLVPNCS
jgi:hypothetical protein